MSTLIIEKALKDHVHVVNTYDGLRHCRCGWKSTMPSSEEVRRAEQRYRQHPSKDGRYALDFVLQPVEAGDEHRRHIAEAIAGALEADSR